MTAYTESYGRTYACTYGPRTGTPYPRPRKSKSMSILIDILDSHACNDLWHACASKNGSEHLR